MPPPADGEARRSAAPAATTTTALTEPLRGFSLASLMMFVTLAAVVMGVSSLAPGVGIPLGIVMLVVWLRTTAVVKYRRVHGQAVTRADKVHLFLASFGATLGLLAITCVAGCAAFVAACAACFGTVAVTEPIGDRQLTMRMLLGYTVFVIVLAAILFPVVLRIGRLIHRRWRRDIGQTDLADDRATDRILKGIVLLIVCGLAIATVVYLILTWGLTAC